MLKNALNTLKKRKFENDIMHHEENQYLNLIDDILNEGEIVEGRNGKTLAVFGSSMNFSLENNNIPLLTTKKVAWKTCLKELVWFINGSTDNEILQKQNVKIWNGNASREYLDSVGMTERGENDLGPVYGHQWRFFNAKYSDCKQDYTGEGIDQLTNIIKDLKDNKKKYSRRLIMSAWNPCQLHEMALPPCHVLVQFNVLSGDKLSCSLYQRSGDVGLGVPFNIASYSMLTHILAKHCNLEAKEFVHFIGNAHIYDDHIESLEEQIIKEPYSPPLLSIKDKKNKIEDYNIGDFDIINYKYHKPIKMTMRC